MAFDAKIKLSSDTSRVDAGIAGVQRKISGLSSKMGGAIAGLFSIGLITAGIKNMMDFADNIQEASDRLGVTIQRVQELQLAAKLAGKDIGLFEKAFQNIENAAQAAVGGNSKAIESFKALGISQEQVKTMNKNDLLKLAVGNAAAMPDRSNAEMLLGNILGKKSSGTLLGISESVTNPESMGGKLVDDDTINALADANDQLTLFIENLRNTAMPDLVRAGIMIMNVVQKFADGLKVLWSYIGTLINNIEKFSISRGIKEVAKHPMDALMMLTGPGQMKMALEWMFGDKGKTDESEKYLLTRANSFAKAFFGDDVIQEAENNAAVMGQVATDQKAENDARLKQLKDSRVARQKSLAADVNRTGTVGGGKADKGISLGEVSGGPSGVSIGNLIGVNANYRLERLNVEHNEKLDSIIELLKDKNEDGWKPPTE
jgi:hypothetical protein